MAGVEKSRGWIGPVCGLLVFLLGWPAAAQSLDEQLAGRDEADVTFLAMRTIPTLVYSARTDSLVDWVNAWENTGGPREAVTRIRILGAIWDGQFGEDLYDYPIIDDLLWHTDPERLDQESPAVSGDLVSAGFSGSDPYAEASLAYDDFTRDFADQLLPHVAPDGIEAFFCLFYAGRQGEAWTLLDSPELEDSDLRYYRDQRIDALERQSGTVSAALVGGGWFPFGKYAFAGDHPIAGLRYGMRGKDWFVRLALEYRLGRTETPYRVDEDGLVGVSDRFNALLGGVELGRAVLRIEPFELNAFAGAGVDMVRPFAEEDGALQALHLSLGGGGRVDLGRRRAWFVSLDWRREWVKRRNQNATHLYGDAWSMRAGIGLNFGQENRETLRRLRP